MKNITIELPEDVKLSINGIEYPVMKADYEIINTAIELGQLAEVFKANSGNTTDVSNLMTQCAKTIDETLGEGALDKILQGKKATIGFVLALIQAIANEAIVTYQEKTVVSYDAPAPVVDEPVVPAVDETPVPVEETQPAVQDVVQDEQAVPVAYDTPQQ